MKEPDADREASKSEDGACTAMAIPFSDDDAAPHEKSDNFKCSHKRPGEASSLKCFITNIDNQSASDREMAAEIAMGAEDRNIDMVVCGNLPQK